MLSAPHSTFTLSFHYSAPHWLQAPNVTQKALSTGTGTSMISNPVGTFQSPDHGLMKTLAIPSALSSPDFMTACSPGFLLCTFWNITSSTHLYISKYLTFWTLHYLCVINRSQVPGLLLWENDIVTRSRAEK